MSTATKLDADQLRGELAGVREDLLRVEREIHDAAVSNSSALDKAIARKKSLEVRETALVDEIVAARYAAWDEQIERRRAEVKTASDEIPALVARKSETEKADLDADIALQRGNQHVRTAEALLNLAQESRAEFKRVGEAELRAELSRKDGR